MTSSQYVLLYRFHRQAAKGSFCGRLLLFRQKDKLFDEVKRVNYLFYNPFSLQSRQLPLAAKAAKGSQWAPGVKAAKGSQWAPGVKAAKGSQWAPGVKAAKGSQWGGGNKSSQGVRVKREPMGGDYNTSWPRLSFMTRIMLTVSPLTAST